MRTFKVTVFVTALDEQAALERLEHIEAYDLDVSTLSIKDVTDQ